MKNLSSKEETGNVKNKDSKNFVDNSKLLVFLTTFNTFITASMTSLDMTAPQLNKN